MPKSWFQFKALAADSTADSVEVSIYDEIGMWGVSAKDFIAHLQAQKGKKVTCSINSPGGSVFDALAIYNALRAHGSEITVKVMGVAASAASLIAMAGDKIIMPENTFLMIHNPWAFTAGNADELRDFADTLDKIGSSLTKTYVARTGMAEEEVNKLLAAETWMTAQEAVALGFADEMEPALKVAASYDTERLPDNVRAAFDAAASATPDNDPNDPNDPTVPPQDTFADQINAMAVAAGMQDFVGVWALNPSLKTVEEAQAKINEAREVRSLCVLAKQTDKVDGFIRAGKSLQDVRATLFDALASEDEKRNTSNANTGNSTPPKHAPQAAVKTADIWAARNSR